MNRKLLAIVLTLCMILSMMPTAAFAAGDDFHDIDGHWAEEVIEKWADRNIVSGMGNNQFNPNGEMTRAQAAAVFANFFGLSKKADVSHFTDVEDAWYTDAIAMCVEAGIMSGVGNNKMDPHGTLTREQMFTMFANGLGLKPEPTSEKEFADDHKTSGWAQGYVNALVNRGFVSGMGGNKLAPDQEINRASVMALIDSTVAEYVTESGATVEAPKDGGMVIVVADDVTITGELSGTVLAVGGDTKITVEKATADAEVVVASGSENVTVAGEFAGTVTVAANDTTVKVENATEEAKVVVAAENTTVEGEIKGTVEVADGATGTTVAAETAKVEVTGESATVAVTGKVETVEVKETAAGSSVEVAKDATVTTVKTEAAESTVNVAGTVKDVEVSEKAGNTTVTTESTAKVENVKTEAAGTTVEGTGTVSKVEATENATGTTVNTNGSAVENNSKEDVTVGAGTVESGSTGTSAGETSKPSEGITPTPTPTPSHSHKWGAWISNEDGTHTRSYTCGHTNSQTEACKYDAEYKCTECKY
ncbi:MAG: S-layer homology domain-containing protein, partial [Firmicutes bacterium]|nr:S-layer homology domain-containing protein [Bacillota bacterium]